MLFSKQTPAAGGDAFAQFDAAWCYNGNGYIFNDTGTSLDVRIGDSGSVQTVAAGKTLPIKLVYSMAELYVRRTDQSATQVTVKATVGLNAGAADGGGGGSLLIANDQTGSYVLAASDVTGSTEIRQNSATGVNLTINADVSGKLFTPVYGKQVGAGQVTFVAGSGVTLRIPNSATKTAYQYSAWAAVQVSANVWEITGSLA